MAEELRPVIVEETREGKFPQRVRMGPHELRSDEPVSYGGTDTGPSPYELLLAAVGACTSMTLRLYADRKGWPLKKVTVTLRHRKVHAKDCADCETKLGRLDEIERDLTLEGPLTPEQEQRLLEIAERCPVHMTLHSEVKVRTRVVR